MAKSKKIRMPAGIRNKLMAAVSMLLVSTIMMVSTTYAWFTLSTAPEVTGITTSVGANGNLEMALLTSGKKGENDEAEIPNTFDDLGKISSAVGDSSSATKDVTKSNITWGNLVDLDNEAYGLKTINLMPARLNITGTDSTDAAVVTTSLLKTAVYGKDGRVDTLEANTSSTASYETNSWLMKNTYGVRAIGTNDNLTKQQSGLMAAKSDYASNMSTARSTMTQSIVKNGEHIAKAVASMAMGGTAALTTEQKTAIKTMLDDTLTAMTSIDKAYQYVLLAEASRLNDSAAYVAASGLITSAENYSAALEALQTAASESGATVSAPTNLTSAVKTLNEKKTAVQTKLSALSDNAEENTAYTAALEELVVKDKAQINGFKVGTAPEGEDENNTYIKNRDGSLNGKFLTSAGSGINVQLPDDSGVLSYIGKTAGNYTAGFAIKELKVGSFTATDVKASMATTATPDTTVSTLLNGITAAGKGDTTAADTALSDTYGYALDFAFRTNAADSKLQLQTEGAQRVYAGNTNKLTQGNGSTMTFKSAEGASLTGDKVKTLMGSIRVAFVDPITGTIHGIAVLDTANATETEGSSYTSKLYLHDYTINKGVLNVGEKKTGDDAVSLMAMQQNTAQRLTVIVWLDGDSVDNGDVANAAQSITGSLNLQFSSSAKLVPMENTALKNLTETNTPGGETTGGTTDEGEQP